MNAIGIAHNDEDALKGDNKKKKTLSNTQINEQIIDDTSKTGSKWTKHFPSN